MKRINKRLTGLCAVPLAVSMALPGYAQMPDEGFGLEEIVVTARKREENLLVVPLAITAVTNEQLDRQGVKDITGLTSRDPSLNFDTGLAPYDTRIVIRGLSPTRGRPNVATLVDGIDVSSEAIGVAGGSLLINPRLLDISQVEIVKGPQSALFGRSAFAGAIAYTTQDPSRSFTSGFSMDINDEQQYEAKINVSGPLGDTLGYRLSGYVFEDDGFYKNAVTNQSTGGGVGRGGALTLRWDPNESYSAKLRAEVTNDKFDPPAQAALAFNAFNAVPANASICNVGVSSAGRPIEVGFVIDRTCPVNPTTLALGLHAYRELERLTGNRGVFDDMSIPAFVGAVGSARGLQPSFNPNHTRSTDGGRNSPNFPGSDRGLQRFSLVQNIDSAVGRFSLLTGVTKADVDVLFDIDKTSFGPIQQTLETYSTTDQFSQELRFTSDFDGPINFFAGLQYWKESIRQNERNVIVIGEGTTCFAFGPPFSTTAIQSPPGPAGPLNVPFGSCTNPTGGFTSTDVSAFMSRVYAQREFSLTTRDTDHRSFYLDVEFEPTDSLKLIAEARWVQEKNDVSAGFTDGSNGPGTLVLCGSNGPCLNGAGVPAPGFPPILPPAGFNPPDVRRQIVYPTLKEDYVTPKATVQWTPSADLNVYASYAQARKPGGYSTVTLAGTGAPASGDDLFFEAERLKVYELGAKWRSPGGNLRVETALFRTDFTDKQVGTQILTGNTISNRVTNAGKALLEGLELSAQWKPADRWLVSGGLTYFSKYEYTDYRTTSTGAGEIARVGNCTIGYLDGAAFVALGNNPRPLIPGTTTPRSLTCQLDRTGNLIEDTPELALAMAITYRRPIGDSGLELLVDLDANWEDERFIEDDNTGFLNSYWLANLRLGLQGEKWTAILYADNLMNDRTIRSAGSGPAIYASDFRLGFFNYFPPGPPTGAPLSRGVFPPSIPTTVFANLPSPRVVGLRVNYRF